MDHHTICTRRRQWLTLAALAAAGVSGPARASAGTFAELLAYLGLDSDQDAGALRAGGVLHNGRPRNSALPEEVSAAGAMLLVRAKSAQQVVESFLHAETFQRVHDVRRRTLAEPSALPTGAALRGLPMRELTSSPERLLNLSPDEAAAFKAIDARAGDAPTRAESALRAVLGSRLQGFVERGLGGVAPYARPGQAARLPGAELGTALRSLSFLADSHPTFVPSLRLGQGGHGTRTLHWIETEFDGRPVIGLTCELRQHAGTSAIGADLHYYATSGYNAMLTVIGVQPHDDDRWLAYALNHTFTDQVLGFASGAKHAVARTRVAEVLARHLEAARASVEGRPGAVRRS